MILVLFFGRALNFVSFPILMSSILISKLFPLLIYYASLERFTIGLDSVVENPYVSTITTNKNRLEIMTLFSNSSVTRRLIFRS